MENNSGTSQEYCKLKEPLKEIIEMGHSPRSNDVILLGRDRVPVHAHKPALAAGSPMFRSMLTPADGLSWSESKQTEISFPELSSTAILPVVKYLEILFTLFDSTLKDRLRADLVETLDNYDWDDLISADIIGILDAHQTSWEDAFEVILAARFFLLDTDTGIYRVPLEDIIFDYLDTFVASGVSKLPDEEDMMTAAYMLSFLFEFLSGDGIRRSMDYRHAGVARRLVRVLLHRPLEPVHLAYLNFEAIEHVLSNRIFPHTNIEEYLMLRSVLLWSACQVSHKQAVQLSAHYLPDARLALWLLGDPLRMQHYESPKDASHFLKSIMQKSQFHKDNLAKLLSHIDLTSIHTALLLKIVEPLDLFPHEQVSKAITSFHPIRVVFCRNRWDYNAHTPIGLDSYKYRGGVPIGIVWGTLNDADRIVYKGNGKGTRGCRKEKYDDQMPFRTEGGGMMNPTGHWDERYCSDFLAKYNVFQLWRGYGSYEWDMFIETPREDRLYFPEIGVEGPFDCDMLSWREKSWSFWAFTIQRSGQCVLSPTLDDHCRQWKWQPCGKRVGYQPRHVSVVRVQLDMSARSCVFYYRGEQFSTGWTKVIAWKNMPRGGYRPAIRFSGPRPVTVRIVLGSGF